MFKPVNIFIGFIIAVFGYIFISYGGGVGNYLTADVFRTDAKIAGDVYYTDNNSSFDLYSNFESESGDLSLILTRDPTKVEINSNQIKSEYNSDITDISENILKINIKKEKPFAVKASLLTVKYSGEPGYINVSDAKMSYASGSEDMLAITRLNQ